MIIVLLLGLALWREAREEPLVDVEETFVNWLAANSTRTSATAPLVLVEIDDSSVGSQHPWPWTPIDYALFLEDALTFKPAVVGVEPVMQWNLQELPADIQLQYPQFEKILHERILRSPKIVLGAELGFPEDPDVMPPIQPVPVLRNVTGSLHDVPIFTTVEREPIEALRLAAELGFTNVPVVKEPLRRAPLVFSYQGQIVPSFLLQALLLWFKLTPDDVRVNLGASLELGDQVSIPIDAAGSMLVDFKSPFTRVGFEDLLLAVEQIEAKVAPVVAPDALKDKFVMLGRTDEGARIFSLPIGRRGSAGEVLAAALATVQNGVFIRPAPGWWNAVILAGAILLSWFLCRRPRRLAIILTSLAIILYLMAGLVIFASAQVALPFSMPIGLAIFIALFRLFAPQGGWLPGGLGRADV